MAQGIRVLKNDNIRREATEELLHILAVNGPMRTSDLGGTPKFHGVRTLSNQTICRLLRESGKAEMTFEGYGGKYNPHYWGVWSLKSDA
jgi:hypothetical protein